MRIVVTSDGRRVGDICPGVDARRAVHSLGVTQLRGPESWMLSTTSVIGSSPRSRIKSG